MSHYDFIFVCHLGCSISSPLQNITTLKKNRQTTLSLPRILSYFSLNTGLDSLRWYQPYFRAKVWKASTVLCINSIRFRSVITFFLTSVKDISLYLARVSRNKSTTFCKRMEWNLMNKVFLHYHYLKTTADDYFSVITIFLGICYYVTPLDQLRASRNIRSIITNSRYKEWWWLSKVEN